MSNIAPLQPPQGSATALVTAEHAAAIRAALKSSLYPGATDESVDMVLAYCRAASLDPMTKPVHIVPIWVPEKKTDGRLVSAAGMRDVVMPGIELYRTKAHRTGEYAGQDDAEFGPTVEESLGGVQVRYPEWCRVTVYRTSNGQRVPYSARVYWLETYATAKRDTEAPNAMWKKRPFGQLEKCAEALALRKAFPEAIGAQPTADEMAGKSIGTDAIDGASRRDDRVVAEQPAQLPAYSEVDFAKNFPLWQGIIESGKRTAADIVAMVESKARLTESQRASIFDLQPADVGGAP